MKLIGRTRVRKLAIIIAAGALGAAAVPASGGELAPADRCTMKGKKAYKAKRVFKRGLPIQVTCDGPAKYVSGLSLIGKADHYVNREAHPGEDGWSKVTTVDGAGTRPLKLKVSKWAKKAIRKNGGARIFVLLAVENEKGDLVKTADNEFYSRIKLPR